MFSDIIKHIFFFLFSILFLQYSTHAQIQTIDSLKTELTKVYDSSRINLLLKISQEYWSINPDTVYIFAKEALELAKKSENKKKIIAAHNSIAVAFDAQGNFKSSLVHFSAALLLAEQINDKPMIARIHCNKGNTHRQQGDFSDALKHYSYAMVIAKELGLTKGISIILGNIGLTFDEQGNYPNALRNYMEALKTDKDIGDQSGVAIHLGNIGGLYLSQGKLANDDSLRFENYSKALGYFLEALEIDKKIGNKVGVARHLGNIGIIHSNRGDLFKNDSIRLECYNKALKYYHSSMEMDTELGIRIGVADHLVNIASVYMSLGDMELEKPLIGSHDKADTHYKKALDTFFKSLKIMKENGDQVGIATVLGNIGSVFAILKKYSEAEKFFHDALEISTKTGALALIKSHHKKHSDLYVNTNHYQLAYEHYKQYSVAKDSLFNEEKSKQLGSIEQKYEFEIAELERKKIENEKLIIKNEETKRRNLLQYSGILLALFLLFMSIFLLARRFRKIKENKAYTQYIKIVEVTLFISFLIFFEFILVLLDPYVEQITDGEPAWKLLVNAVLAGAIFPLHSFLEAKLKANVIKKESGKQESEKNSVSKSLLMLLGFLFISFFNISFSDKADSLKTALANAKEDTTKINLLNKLGWELMYQNPDSAILLGIKVLELSEGLQFDQPENKNIKLKFIAHSNSNLGVYYELKGDYPKALAYHFITLKMRKLLNDKKGISISYGNIGNIYKEQNNLTESITFYKKGLKIDEELGNLIGISKHLGNIGIIYKLQGNYDKAIENYTKALEIVEKTNDKIEISYNYIRLAIIYADKNNNSESLNYFLKSLAIQNEINDIYGKSLTLGNIGFLYTKMVESDIGSHKSTLYSNLGQQYLLSAINLSDSIGSLALKKDQLNFIRSLYEVTGQYAKALDYYQQYNTTYDALFNEEKSKQIGRLEQKHEFEIAEIERKHKEAEHDRIFAELKERKYNLQYSAIFIGIFFLFGLLFFLGKISMPEWLIGLSTIVPFMILFEFVLVLIDPYIEIYTGGEPVFKLLINALCATVIFPAHSFFEKKLKTRIYEIKQKKEKQFAEEFRKWRNKEIEE